MQLYNNNLQVANVKESGDIKIPTQEMIAKIQRNQVPIMPTPISEKVELLKSEDLKRKSQEIAKNIPESIKRPTEAIKSVKNLIQQFEALNSKNNTGKGI